MRHKSRILFQNGNRGLGFPDLDPGQCCDLGLFYVIILRLFVRDSIFRGASLPTDKDIPFRTVPEIEASPHISPVDIAQSELTRSLNKSRRNIERSLIALDGIARAEAAFKDIEHEIVGGRKGLISDD